MSVIKKREEAVLPHISSNIRFILIAIVMVFAIVFLLTETGLGSVVFATIVFILFLKEGIGKEMGAAQTSH